MEYSIKVIAFRPEWVKICGDIESTIFYQQLYYWSDKSSDETEWVYKSIPEFEYETTLTEKQQRRVIHNLVRRGLIQYEVRIAPDHRRTRFFRIISTLEPSVLPPPKGKGYPSQRERVYTENTTDTISKDIGEDNTSLFQEKNPTLKTEPIQETRENPPQVAFSPPLKSYGNPDINEVIQALSKLTPTGKLDGTIAFNRNLAYTLIRSYGKDTVMRAISCIHGSFFEGKITSVGKLKNQLNALLSVKQKGGVTII